MCPHITSTFDNNWSGSYNIKCPGHIWRVSVNIRSVTYVTCPSYNYSFFTQPQLCTLVSPPDRGISFGLYIKVNRAWTYVSAVDGSQAHINSSHICVLYRIYLLTTCKDVKSEHLHGSTMGNRAAHSVHSGDCLYLFYKHLKKKPILTCVNKNKQRQSFPLIKEKIGNLFVRGL